MWDFESPRNKTTVFQHRANSGKKRLKSLSSNPCDILSPNYNQQEIFQNINSQTLVVHPKTGQFMKQQRKLHVSPAKLKNNKQNFNLQLMQCQARSQLKKLSYKEKLLYIQQLLKSTRELCKSYGYFSITFPMLKISYAQQIKIQIWIHPDRRCFKPLHPIKKSTQFECQLSCVFDLKNVIKKLFPMIDLGSNKTFSTLIAHIDSLKLTYDPKSKSKGFLRQNSIKTSQSQNNHVKNNEYYLNETTKTINIIKDPGYKENSTLVETIGSINSLNYKINQKKIKQVSQYKKPKLKQSFSSPFPEQNMENYDKTPVSPNTIHASPQKTLVKSQKNQCQTPQNKVGVNLMKSSMTGQRFMTMSIQIQSQINNLFGNDDNGLNNYYNSSSNKNSDVKNLKNSLLSRVAQEFQDLF